jgi:hypothetical protein
MDIYAKQDNTCHLNKSRVRTKRQPLCGEKRTVVLLLLKFSGGGDILWRIDPFLSNGTVNTSPRKGRRATIEERCFLCGPRRDSCYATER